MEQMILCCGVTREELVSDRECVCVDLLIDGGTADEQLNFYKLDTWKKLIEKYTEIDYIFIDGGIYDSFNTLEEKEEVIKIIQKFCKKGLIIYGDHMLKRFFTTGVRQGKDLLQRNLNVPFTFIPVEQYTMENFRLAYHKASYLSRLQKVRVASEFNCKF